MPPKNFKEEGAIWHYEVQNISGSQIFVGDATKTANSRNPEKSKLM